MKYRYKIACILLGALSLFTSCDDNIEPTVHLTIDTPTMVVGADGGTEPVAITSGGTWVALSNQPWVRLTPANGMGTTECSVIIDSSLIKEPREARIVINTESGEHKTIQITQFGYDEVILLDVEEVQIENSALLSERYVDLTVTTNLLFNVQSTAAWISFDASQLHIDLDRGARPRSITFRFNWSLNPEPQVRTAELLFLGRENNHTQTSLRIVQKAAPYIENSRAGDSLALLIIAEKLNLYSKFDPAENMRNWDNVVLWEVGDWWGNEPITPEMVGRVRYVNLLMFSTKEPPPAEIAKLKYLEHIRFLGNVNHQQLALSLGDAFTNVDEELRFLRFLEVQGYGIAELPESFRSENLELLNLSSNVFKKVPQAINPTNFPKLKRLDFSANRTTYRNHSKNVNLAENGLYMHLSNSAEDKRRFMELLSWEQLEQLNLSYNLIEGSLPSDEELLSAGFGHYTSQDVAGNDTIQGAVSYAKVLPQARGFSINLNALTGDIPNWLLYHPYLTHFDPFTLVYNQEGFNSEGKPARFNNEPTNFNYYYEVYPLWKPSY